MSEAAAKLLEQIRALPAEDRQWIADVLVDETTDVDDPMDDPEWRAEFERRLDEVQNHPERLIDGGEAMRMIREHLDAKRSEPKS